MIDRDMRLLDNLSWDFCFVAGNDSAGIHDLPGPSTPSHRPIDAIAGDAGFVGNNRATLADQTIEESRLAYVRAADDCDQAVDCRHSMNFAFLLEDSTSNWGEEFSARLVGGIRSSRQRE